MSHTPGPWVVDKSCLEDYTGDTPISINTDKGESVADAWSFNAPKSAVANARLIAAAPEMLEVLQALRGAVAGHQFTRMDVEAIRAAIAKATEGSE